ncbi:isocitrate lyase/phosphoenolpyruvate mutase family protein [bacterium RCC_150]
MTTHPELESKAIRFHELHHLSHAPLILVNAWDAASARMVEEAGATAVATSSSAISWSSGYRDGNHLPRELAMEALERIASAVRLPVTADIETGYGRSDVELRGTVQAVLDAGAIGINIEDSADQPLTDIAEQARRISLIRHMADEAGVELFINARTDTYWSGKYPDTAYEETLKRAESYQRAGADGIFVPGVVDLHILHELSRRIAAPLNALAGFGSPSPGELHDVGVRRISLGGSPARAAYAAVSRLAKEVLGDGKWSGLAGSRSYFEMDALFGER